VLSSTANGQLPSQHKYKNSNTTTQDKQTTKTTTKHRKIEQLRLSTLKYDLLKLSVDLQTAFAAENHPAEGATESVKVTYVPGRNTNADCFQERGAMFSATKDIY
jgi:hypothetical protein